MTTAVIEPTAEHTTDDTTAPAMPACPDLCDGQCHTWNDGEGAAHHTSGFDSIIVANGCGTDFELDVSASRTDENYEAGDPVVNLLALTGGFSAEMSPVEARQLAAMLMNAADSADPLPSGAMVTTAGKVRVGDELLTEDGWQQVTGLLFLSTLEQASIFTPERDEEDSDGWNFSSADVVTVRRPVHGSCAIQFVEPIR